MKKLLSLLGGILIGAIAALLLAPQSGSDTREQIKKLVQEKVPNLKGEELEKFVDELIAKVKGRFATVEVNVNEAEADE